MKAATSVMPTAGSVDGPPVGGVQGGGLHQKTPPC